MDRQSRRAPDAEWVLMYRLGLSRKSNAELVRAEPATVGYHLVIARRRGPEQEVAHLGAIDSRTSPSHAALARLEGVIRWVVSEGRFPRERSSDQEDRSLAWWFSQGNCLPLDAKIATPTGWTTMGEVAVGDEILTPFGTATRVTDKYDVKVRPVYRLTLRDGSSVEACRDHLWPVERWKSRITYLGGKGENGKRLYVGGNAGKTAELITETISTEELKARVDKGRQVDMIRIEPVAYSEADLPVDPYVLGAILGDAHIDAKGGVFFYCNDFDVIEEIRRRGYDVVPYGVAEGACPKYAINGLRHLMRELGVAGKRAWEKSIPQEYVFSSVKQRVDLLRGLMDTDGTISAKGEMEFCSSSAALAADVQTVIRSLGGRVAVNVKEKVLYTSPKQVDPKEGRPAHRVQNIRLPRINPFLLARKAGRWSDRTRGFNRVISVEYVRDDLVQCIRVADERHLYLADDFIPTHNTSNIVFLKSTDDSMIDTLQKMSGTKHRPTQTPRRSPRASPRGMKALRF
jgi:hypothetical protein